MKINGLCILAATFGLGISTPALTQTSQILTKPYDSGGVYTGTFKEGLQHGRGTYVLPNGYEYDGEWVNGQNHIRRWRHLYRYLERWKNQRYRIGTLCQWRYL